MDVVLVPGRPPLVAGPATRSAALSFPSATCAVGLRFLPGAAPTVLGVEAAALRDQVVPLGELGGASWPQDLEAAWDAVQRGDPNEALGSLAEAVTCMPRVGSPDPSVRRAAELLRHDPNLTIAVIAKSMSCTPRTLLRRFERGVGYGPKSFAQIMRLHYFLRVQERCPEATLGWLAAYTGFADQAHLTRSCITLAGRRLGRRPLRPRQPTRLGLLHPQRRRPGPGRRPPRTGRADRPQRLRPARRWPTALTNTHLPSSSTPRTTSMTCARYASCTPGPSARLFASPTPPATATTSPTTCSKPSARHPANAPGPGLEPSSCSRPSRSASSCSYAPTYSATPRCGSWPTQPSRPAPGYGLSARASAPPGRSPSSSSAAPTQSAACTDSSQSLRSGCGWT